MPLKRRATFWSASSVLALCLWSSAAPSDLYPIYEAQWKLSSVVITSVFGTYPLALLLVLLLFGGVSDRIGRRRAILVGITLMAAAAVLFAVAPNVGWLFAARALQGFGTGFAIGAASARLVETNISKNPRFASSITTASTAVGMTLAMLLTGVVAQLAPLPLVLSYVVLAVLTGVAFLSVALTADDRPARVTERFRSRAPRLAPGTVRPFIAATLSVSVAYSVGAPFLSLGASMARELTHTTNLITVGSTLAASTIMIGVTALSIQRVPPHLAIVIGAVVSIVELGVMADAAASGSLVLLLIWGVLVGIGFGFAFTGGLALVSRTMPPTHRGGTLSLVYLFSYFLQAATAIGAGALATSLGLAPALETLAPLIGLLCIASITVAAIDVAGNRRTALAASTIAAEPVSVP